MEGVEAVPGDFRETVEVVGESGFFVALKVVIAKCRIDRDLMLAPSSGLRVPDQPVLSVVSAINNVASDADKGRAFVCNGGDESLANSWIGMSGVGGIVKARIAKSDEAEGNRGL